MTETIRRNTAICLLFAVVAIVFTLPVHDHPGYLGIQDWDGYLLFDALARSSWLTFGQIPLWDPYLMGGMPMLAYPESNIFSPALLVQLLVHEVLAAKINITLHAFIGLGGAYALARQFKLTAQAALLSAFIYMVNSMYSLVLTAGMEWGFGIAMIPWSLFFFLKAREDYRHVVSTSVALLLMWLGGGVYPFTISLLLMGTYGVAEVVTGQETLSRTVVLLGAIYGLTFALGAFKFLPAIEFTHRYTRHSELYAGLSVETFLAGLLGRDQTLSAIGGLSTQPGFISGASQGMDEIGMYVGIVPCLLFLVGMVTRFRRYLVVLLCLVVFVWLSFGDRSAPLSLWHLVKAIPPYSLMRSVERFRLAVILLFAITAGGGLVAMSAMIDQRFPGKGAMGGWLLIAFVLFDLMLVNSRTFKDAFPIPPVTTQKYDHFVQVGGFPEYSPSGFHLDGSHDIFTSFGASYLAFLANAGSIHAYESMPVPVNAVMVGDPRYRGEVYLQGTAGKAWYLFWSPNRLRVQVQALGEGWLVINQNYYPGWKARGLKTASVDGLLAVPVAPGVKEVEFYYRPNSFVAGAVISFLTLIAVAVWMFRRRNSNCTFPAGKPIV
ncbi:MAG: hypothetical protein KJ950_01450 [Proteobacteria bacterium]|nr:hypothetical protein [Pseudomonadota bacterium]MBU1687335.1 hypothetical protein [Pseudomonadota bacterium]